MINILYDVIIVGKGPAGISAAIYLQRANIKTLVIGLNNSSLEKTDKVENYYGFSESISGKELLNNGEKQAKKFGTKIENDEVLKIEYDSQFKVTTKNSEFFGKKLVLATGVTRKKNNIKGITKYEGKGISYCAVCDAFFYKNKDVAVIGNGDYAISEAKELLTVAKSVTIFTNGKNIIENRDKNLKINIIEKPIKEFKGTDILENIIFEDNSQMNVSGVFMAEGIATSVDLAKKIGIILDENGNIKVNEKMETNVPNVYACGDCTGGILQVCKAVYEGSKTGMEIIKKINS